MTTNETVDDILIHYGKLGMKWGQRRAGGAQAVMVSDRAKKIKTSGGKGHPANPDAVRARTLGQIGKKSGLKALSNQELQAYSTRLNLEQNVKRLNYNEKSRGGRFIDSLLGRQGNALAREASKTAGAKAGRSALNAATRKSIRVARVAATVSAA